MLSFVRVLYFSVVTMTTLGFGDMYAEPGSIFGHILLIFQVLLGYVLLGALITRFAILFSGEGPAGKFSKQKEKKPENKDNKKFLKKLIVRLPRLRGILRNFIKEAKNN